MTARTLTVAGGTYPLVLPSIRDPRLHVATVIISIHVLGQLGLEFQVSIPQILAAILTCAVIEVALTFRASRAFVWPASAMLTGSGVALILRVVGTPSGQPWVTDGWYIFAGVAAFSLLTKYVIKARGSHVFNPSNIGLVVAFIVLGSAIVEPLDFWWAPLNIFMLAAYLLIVGGGLLITRRLGLLVLAASYWVTLNLGIGLLAASDHCMVTRWAFAPVCGQEFWWVIVTSPEVLIFLLFMITDPKTVPAGRVARFAFGMAVAITTTLLVAPQTNEYDTKVALLASLAVMSVVRLFTERFFPAPRSEEDTLSGFARRTLGDGGSAARTAGRLALAGIAVLVIGVGVVAAGSPSRGVIETDAAEILNRVAADVDPATFPAITVSQDAVDWDHQLADAGAQQVLLTLAENLEYENQAMQTGDARLLQAVDHGDRLAQMEGRLATTAADGSYTIGHYDFDDVTINLLQPFGVQTGLSLGLEGRGTLVEETYGADGRLQQRREFPFERTFVMRRATGDRWMNVAVIPTGSDPG